MRHFGGSSKDLADQWVCFAVRFARGEGNNLLDVDGCCLA
jgi:hypothetical protein